MRYATEVLKTTTMNVNIKAKPQKREENSPFTETEIDKMYRNILLPIEIDNLDLRGYNIMSPKFIQQKQTIGFDYDTKGEIKTGSDAVEDTFYFRLRGNDSTIPSLLKHIRNAFAHNRVFYDNNLHNIVLEDENNGVLNMYVRLATIDRLIEIVNAIKSTKGIYVPNKKKKTI